MFPTVRRTVLHGKTHTTIVGLCGLYYERVFVWFCALEVKNIPCKECLTHYYIELTTIMFKKTTSKIKYTLILH